MTLLTAERYAELTGDTTVPTAQQLADAQADVEAYLRRGLELEERTERVRLQKDEIGYVTYPKCTPIASAADGLSVDGPAIYGAVPETSPVFEVALRRPAWANITYTGGWTIDTAPMPILRGLARETRRVLHPVTVAPGGLDLSGARSVRVGDAAVTYAPGHDPAGTDGVTPTTAAELSGYRHRDIAAV